MVNNLYNYKFSLRYLTKNRGFYVIQTVLLYYSNNKNVLRFIRRTFLFSF